MGKFAEDLSKILENTEADNQYRVLKVLKDDKVSRVEKVSKDGKVYIRRYFQEEQNPANDLPLINCAPLPQIYDSYRLADRIVIIERYLESSPL
ncbi:MAG: hypothetical protein FWF88_09320 [Peptococcaceae bacterium]|jgi:hypothetical protein|nr:hypothetical protein [Peptococcaceae bacterium]